MMCATCRQSLNVDTDNNGVRYIHRVLDDTHAVVPVYPGTEFRGRCDFCSDGTPAWVLPARDFTDPNDPDHASSAGNWGAFDPCAALIRDDQWDAVVARVVASEVHRAGLADDRAAEIYAGILRELYVSLRHNIIGPLAALDPAP
jgi:hypothetical protein